MSSVSPERCEMTVAYPASRAIAITSSDSVSVPIWFTFTRIAFADALVDPPSQELDVRHEEVVADELDVVAERAR